MLFEPSVQATHVGLSAKAEHPLEHLWYNAIKNTEEVETIMIDLFKTNGSSPPVRDGETDLFCTNGFSAPGSTRNVHSLKSFHGSSALFLQDNRLTTSNLGEQTQTVNQAVYLPRVNLYTNIRTNPKPCIAHLLANFPRKGAYHAR